MNDVDLTGRQLGDYQILRRLGTGAMAEVYLAEQGSLRRQVAWKVLKGHLATDVSYVRRFHHEAQAAASLVHANIVQIYDVGCVDGIHYIAQEYVQGQNLRELLRRNGPFDVRLALHVMRQVAAALCKAAERGIVHRDIKPDNIMLARSGEVKVADFGLARVVDSVGETNLTQVGITMGTPLYMSPEQIEGRSLDARSDLYALGVTCYHMLTGSPPFEGETVLSVAVQHLKTEPRPLEELRPDLPVALTRIIHRMLAKSPDDRYESPREVLRDLRALPIDTGESDELWATLTENEGVPTIAMDVGAATMQLAEATRAVQQMAQRRGRWRRALLVGAVATLILGAGLRWRLAEPFLLAGAADASITPAESARDQLFLAQMQRDNIEQWLLSVERFFPQEQYYIDRARQELARYYMQTNRRDEALSIFRRMSERREPEAVELRAFGLAGMVVVYNMERNRDAATEALTQLWPIRDRLQDRRLAALLGYALQTQRAELDQETARGWDTWLQSLPPAEDNS